VSLPWWLGGALAIARRPRLWAPALRQVAALAGPTWWRRFPPLPLPDRSWLAFRMETAYGDKASRPSASELIDFLEWCRETRLFGRSMQ
jgi:hypothetical protein